MKCITLAENLKPRSLGGETKYSGRRREAKYFFEEAAKNLERKLKRSEKDTENENTRENVGDRSVTLGSEDLIYSSADVGLFSSIFLYNSHLKLRTSPEDWWFVVIRKVAIAIDKHSKHENVRKMFVEHEGKKTLDVKVNSNNIYDVNYTTFFDAMSCEISKNVKVPGYVDLISADFSSSTPVQKIVSQITWIKVIIIYCHCLHFLFFIKIFKKLLATYCGKPDCEWWSKIVSKEGFGSGPRRYEGWIPQFMANLKSPSDFSDFTSGLVTVQLTLSHLSGLVDEAALVAGCLGYQLHENDDNIPSVQPYQGWCLMLPKNSPFRAEHQ
ncbi:LOW QUALITY PROTEIN: uncharacterized protein LOC124459261 [Xenia sp. Carnegie-2017]|uniref:LOW QUALITY PROTEIN: uncharacterized protein LOC124459261 n=1 Tax=Xenia sp. Carnegie-2017 TaxID=2897299 RepID=UPI001F037DFA|nr:LOW QUALITY PROTEIN: uncharacterized protein LOC124459261 [Xenia sp. Carnegie-2017]